jgi:hypothetical protein
MAQSDSMLPYGFYITLMSIELCITHAILKMHITNLEQTGEIHYNVYCIVSFIGNFQLHPMSLYRPIGLFP